MKVIKANLKYAKPLIPLVPEKVLFIILHHPYAEVYSPEQCHADHLRNEWAGAGYNEYIRKDGTVYIMRGDHIGAQCANNNSKSYGICCEGDYDTEREMPQAQFDALVQRLKCHSGRFKNLVGIEPHGKFNATSCPGKYFPLEKAIDALQGRTAAQDLYSAIEKLQRAGIINSPEYWEKNAVIDGNVIGEYAGSLIIRVANKL